MPFEKTEKIWMDGELVPWDEARVHVLTHSLHYGSGVFEGFARMPPPTAGVFHLTDHIERLLDSARVIMMRSHPRRDRRGVQLTVRERSRATSARSRSSATGDRSQSAAVRRERVDHGVAVGRLPGRASTGCG
jgi:branched-subunit amino acid aminotransferase/4-amino-4-deoxychorismate lyase